MPCYVCSFDEFLPSVFRTTFVRKQTLWVVQVLFNHTEGEISLHTYINTYSPFHKMSKRRFVKMNILVLTHTNHDMINGVRIKMNASHETSLGPFMKKNCITLGANTTNTNIHCTVTSHSIKSFRSQEYNR